MSSSPHLEVADLAVERGGREVLRGLTFEVRRGEIFGLLGPNGAGKTTAFHVLTGLLRPRAGRFTFEGRATSPHDRAFRERIGVVFQEPALDPRLTARENLRLAGRLYGLRRAVAASRIEALLARVELSDRADEAISSFSGGMRRRIEIVRALLHEPGLLILDEPTTGLDEGAFRATWSHLRSLNRERGLTLLLTTHRPEEAEHCDRLGILDGGTMIACDTPEHLRARVRGDLLVLEADDAAGIASAVRERLGLDARVVDGRILIEREHGHELVPRIVEAFPDGTLRSVAIRRAGLGEVFLELTGRNLEGGRSAA